LHIFFRFVKDNFGNIPLHEMKPKHALRYQNWLIGLDLSSAAVKFKRAAVSSICGYLELYYLDDYPMFRNIYNKKIPSPAKAPAYEKKPLTKNEFDKLVTELERRQEWQYLCYLLVSYETAGRREEVRQLRKEIALAEKVPGKNYYLSHEVRGKGRGKVGKKFKLVLGDRAMAAIQKWLEVRGEDDCPYLFVIKNGSKVEHVSASAFNYWCSNVFSPILGGRRLHPHLLRSTRATHIVAVEGKDIKSVKSLLHHESVSTSEIYVVRDTDEDLDDAFEP
jgi:integrase